MTSPTADRPAERPPAERTTMERLIGGSPIAVLGRLVLISILVGVVLSALGLDPLNLIRSIERLLRHIYDMGFDAVNYVWRYFLLGAVLVVPVWIVMRVFGSGRK
jgi:Domain of unknown function (DUF6460)